jgi:hypothetical protein
MYVDYEPLDAPTLSRELVAEEQDLSTLEQWALDLRIVAKELGTVIHSLLPEETHAMRRKRGYVLIAQGWVDDRIYDLGGQPPETGSGKQLRRLRHHLTCANQKLEKQNKQLKELRAKLAERESA